MSDKISKKEKLFSLTQEEIDINAIKTLLDIFNFNIPEEQLPYIKINSLKKWRISFTNNFTKEEGIAYYTSECPAYAGNCRYSGEDEKYLGQIIKSESVTKVNWFYVQGDRYSCDPFEMEPVYVPPYKREKVAIIEQAIFSDKIPEGDFVLSIQKEYPKSNKRANLEVEIYKGDFNEVYKRQFGDVLEANNMREIVRMKYGLNKDYNYYETGSIVNKGDLNETRYLYGRNMTSLTDYQYKENALVDNRLVYGVDHYNNNGPTYHGVISEDGSNQFKYIQPMGMMTLAEPLQTLENAEEKPISKIYFQGRDKIRGTKTLSIIKDKEKVKITRNQMQYDKTGDFRKRIGYELIGVDEVPSISDGAITTEEIQNAINRLHQNNPEDEFVEAICNELEIFIERKNERKELSKKAIQVTDICNPNSTIHFDIEVIIDMILKQGVGYSISSIINNYSTMFRNNRQSIINCNREIENKKIK